MTVPTLAAFAFAELSLEPRIFGRADPGQPVDEGGDLPEFFIGLGIAECGHSAHLDAVLGDPEDFLDRPFFGGPGQRRRIGAHAGRPFMRLDAGRSVAMDAIFHEFLRPFAQLGLGKGGGGRQLIGAAGNRRLECGVDGRTHDAQMRIGRGEVVGAGEDDDRADEKEQRNRARESDEVPHIPTFPR